jgi:hypothetical protein
MHAQDSFSTRRRHLGGVPLDDTTPESFVEAQAVHICFEHPQVQSRAGSFRQELTSDGAQKLFTDAPTTSLRTNVKIVHKAPPDGIEITIATDKRQSVPGRVESHVHELSWRTITESLRPNGKTVGLDPATQEFRLKNVGIRVTPTCDMNLGDGRCVRLGSGSNNDAVQVMPSHICKRA